MVRILGTVFAGLVGLAFGSFLNVCLSRWPAGESVVKPRSHCRNCDRTLVWWENVPLLSWLALRGSCRTCHALISWRYPLVESAVGALWATIASRFFSSFPNTTTPNVSISHSPLYLLQSAATVGGMMLLIWVLVGLAALDSEHLWLPDIVTLPGILLGVIVSLLRGDSLLATSSPPLSVLNQLLRLAFSILIAAGLILLIRWTYWLIRRREGIGLGDAKLMAMLAVWLGLAGAILAFAIGVVLGAAVGIAILSVPRLRRSEETPALTKLPLGTFLCIGGIISSLWGRPILAAYLH
ncbi:MAG TPA: prepilin peptidase [Terracidiphilus sp.]|jgi:leader peptidase (prepilin peptidase)/N-methyltransferase|nr:prepilin peptidase [Terracidiphilus sp.]